MTGESNHYDAVIASPLPGGLRIAIRLDPTGAIRTIDYLPPSAAKKAPESAAARKVVDSLERYFGDPRTPLIVPLAPEGTPFQRRVWEALGAIAPGSTRTYGAVAGDLGSGPRAVGGACRANPIPIVIPCHRVVAAAGLGGYSGSGEENLLIKKWLLAHERKAKDSARG